MDEFICPSVTSKAAVITGKLQVNQAIESDIYCKVTRTVRIVLSQT